MSNSSSQLKQMANKLRAHSLRMTCKTASGHPTTCLSMAELMSVLFFDQMRFDPTEPTAHDADQLVLSKGHAAPILWAALSEAGAIKEDIMTLREVDSVLEGHPTPRVPWVRVATGSLGQGLSAACGIAKALELEGQDESHVFVIMGDGEVAEGAVWEAAQFAGYYKQSKICAIVDLNGLGQSGGSYFPGDESGLEARFAAFGWETHLIDGHNVDAVREALNTARSCKTAPTAIIAKTLKGKGVPLFEGKDGWHGKPLPAENLDKAIAGLGEININLTPNIRKAQSPQKVARPTSKPSNPAYEMGALIATREAYGNALTRLAKVYPQLIALDADTKNSTFAQSMLTADPKRFVECFIAEQNMIGVGLGLASMGWIACCSTFAAFLTRAYDFIRMGVVSTPPHMILVGSHAGVSIGEDGPSQMALEDLAMMRALVQTHVVYPSDAVSAEKLMDELVQTSGISYMRTSRPKTAVIYNNDAEFPLGGSKVLASSEKDVCTLVGAGVTLHESLKAYDILKTAGIQVRVIDAYSIKPIDAKTLQKAARETGRLVTVEDHCVDGGLGDAVCSAVTGLASVLKLGVSTIPRSGKPEELMSMHGIDAASIVTAVKKLVA